MAHGWVGTQYILEKYFIFWAETGPYTDGSLLPHMWKYDTHGTTSVSVHQAAGNEKSSREWLEL